MADSNGSANTIAITVELPQYERSFRVVVSPGACVQDLKDVIARECDGRPRADGQRLIAKGRVLQDGELVEALWADDDAHVVHLAVSPWAWTAGTPGAPSPTSPSSSDDININLNTGSSSNNHNNTQTPLSTNNIRVPGFISSDVAESHTTLFEYPDPPPYIMHLHYRALRALSPTTPAPARPVSDTAEAKEAAIMATQQAGMAWPADVLDAEYPPPGEEGEGVTYSFKKIGALPYLQNLTPNATPTPRQQHALKVLTYTFPLLAGTRLNDAMTGTHIERRLRGIQQRLDAALRRFTTGAAERRGAGIGLNLGGVGGVPNANGFHAQLQIRIPIRALLMSFVLLAFRVLLLMYFFSPARKPLFSLLVGVWVLYEAWGVIRVAFEEADPLARRAAGDAGREAGAGNGVPPGAPGQAGVGGAGGAPNGGAAQQQALHQPHQAVPAQAQPHNISPDYVLSRLARLHLVEEEQYLDPRPSTGPASANTAEPGWFFKARLFVTLFVLTLHPAFWNRRRVLLTQREAKIRTESNARASAEEAERDAQQLLQRRQGDTEGRREAGEEGQNGEAPTPTPYTVEERALQARRAALQQIVERDARRPIWVREYVDRVVRDSWADE